MGILYKLFGRSSSDSGSSGDVDRVRCMDIVNVIRSRASAFSADKGMALVLLEGCRVTLYLFKGVSRCSWSYTNEQFTTDRVGETCLDPESPQVFSLHFGGQDKLLSVLEREFRECEVSAQQLWHLDPNAWDYEVMKSMHKCAIVRHCGHPNATYSGRVSTVCGWWCIGY
jgi:hypothetical protein